MEFLESYPFLTVVPLLVMLVLVVATKRVFEPIIVATAVVYVFSDGLNFITGFIDGIYAVFGDEEGTYPWIVLMLTLFGALIALLIRSGGISAFKRFATRYIRSERSSLLFTWILGIVLFIDDYINNLGIGPTVRELTDDHKVPREQLGFSICCTGTPICALVPLTAFAVFVYSIMIDSGISPEDSSMLTEYGKLIPFLFYPILIVIIALLLALDILPRIGPFRKYYQQLLDGTYELSESEKNAVGEGEDGIEIDESKGSIIDFALPVLLLVGVMLATSDLVLSVIFALILCFVLYIPRKKMTITNFFETFVSGVTDMIFILIIVLMTFVFVEGLNNIGFSDYVVQTVEPLLVGGAIPALTFVTVGIVAFLGVDYWAVMLLIAPVAIPLSEIFAVNPYLTMAAIASGSIFGGTACFFAEQILMCSQAVQRPPVRVALGGLPYSLLGFILTTILYLIVGFVI
jgi:Na+/H+ antiporter NhaC